MVHKHIPLVMIRSVDTKYLQAFQPCRKRLNIDMYLLRGFAWPESDPLKPKSEAAVSDRTAFLGAMYAHCSRSTFQSTEAIKPRVRYHKQVMDAGLADVQYTLYFPLNEYFCLRGLKAYLGFQEASDRSAINPHRWN